tara:strand:+ start:2601 stop:3800 length:1200 start_codon:yes stop_codon:yes gene_type:complete
MNTKNTLLLLLFWFIIHTIVGQDSLKLITKEKLFVAGNPLVIEFITTTNTDYKLYCTNSYGSTILDSEIKDDKVFFKIPNYISNKKGVLSWSIINTKNPVFGQFQIISKEKPTSMETYLGPPRIEAGGTDFTMLVVIPTDDLDNPLSKNTEVVIKHQFLRFQKKEVVFTKNLISYKNIYSPLKSGRMILSSESLSLNSKEYDVNIMPAIGSNFKIYSKRNHEYADGNQITTFLTSVIKDKNNNVVSDGNFVEFFITNKKGNVLKSSGTTINGVAYAKIIHPDHQENWKIKAYMIGIAESNVLEIIYKKVIDTFNVNFSDNNRIVKVGPLKSFMSQMIPDGLQVKLSIYKEEKLLHEFFKTSKDGFAVFTLNKNIYKHDTYHLKITTAGISKEFENKKLW